MIGGEGLEARDGRGQVTLRLEGPIPPAIAALVESDLRTAFGRRGVELNRRDDAMAPALDGARGTGPAAARARATAREMVLTVVAASERLDQTVLTLEGAGASTLTRRLNLTPVPADGRVLALVVAADEMLVASDDERLVRRRAAVASSDSAPSAAPAPAAEPAPEAASPNAGARAKPEPEPPAPARLVAVATTAGAAAAPGHRAKSVAAATFAFDHFTRGQTQIGFDLTSTRRVGSRAYGLLAAQGRQGLTASNGERTGTVETRLLGARLAAGMGLIDDGGPLWLGFDLGARAGRLWLDGHAQDGAVVGRGVGTFVVYVDAMLTLDVRLGRSPVSLRLAVGGGRALLAQVAGELTPDSKGNPATTPVTTASGFAFESQGGIVLSF